jgi:hypothetical protein
MNWNIFYIINQGFLDLLFIGATYFIMYVFFTLTIKALIKNLKEDMEKQNG